jgi:hypothetical protein
MIWVSAPRLFFSRNLLNRAGEKILLMNPINRGGITGSIARIASPRQSLLMRKLLRL